MIKSLFNIRPAEKHPVFLLFSMFFFIVFASITGSSMRDAIFLIHYDKTYLPIMYLFVAITMILIINLYNRSSEGKPAVTFNNNWNYFFNNIISISIFSFWNSNPIILRLDRNHNYFFCYAVLVGYG